LPQADGHSVSGALWVRSVVSPKVGRDQCVAGLGPSKLGGDPSHPVPMVVVPMCELGIHVCRFEWDAGKFAPDFTISPVEGYIAQGMDVQFSITFHPQQINGTIRYEV